MKADVRLVSIRYAKSYDIPSLAAIQLRVMKEYYQRIIPSSYLDKLTLTSQKEEFKRLLVSEKTYYAIMFYKDEAVGFASFSKSNDSDLLGFGEIQGIYILPNYQHLGLGSYFFIWCLKELKKKGYHTIAIWVFAENANAISFYRKHKFEFDQHEKEVFYDDYLLEKRMIRTLPWIGT